MLTIERSITSHRKEATVIATSNEEQRLPQAENEDVEFSESLADADDREAAERAAQADARQEHS
ncbi:YfhD family protein [Paenibacillus filicis]|uniref:YfhD family protein n=1 Tax=Paenibacillus filicis TaxID=669464 RepID=A0ABU9DMH7_9BACL